MALELKKKRGEFTNLQLARRLQAYGIGHTSQMKFSIFDPQKRNSHFLLKLTIKDSWFGGCAQFL